MCAAFCVTVLTNYAPVVVAVVVVVVVVVFAASVERYL